MKVTKFTTMIVFYYLMSRWGFPTSRRLAVLSSQRWLKIWAHTLSVQDTLSCKTEIWLRRVFWTVCLNMILPAIYSTTLLDLRLMSSMSWRHLEVYMKGSAGNLAKETLWSVATSLLSILLQHRHTLKWVSLVLICYIVHYELLLTSGDQSWRSWSAASMQASPSLL